MFAILILFLLVLRALSQGSRITRELSGVLEGLAWEQFRVAGYPERFRDKIGVLVPAYNEADNVGAVLDRIPPEVCGVETAVLVVDDGSRDGTGEVAAAHGAVVARHVINRGGGAALRTGYRLLADSHAAIVVTLDADGQHLPVGDGAPGGARARRRGRHRARLARARGAPSATTRRASSGSSSSTGSSPSSPARRSATAPTATGPCAPTCCPQLVLRQEQFHTSEFMIEAIKRGVPAKEVPVTVVSRLHGHSKKPAVVRYGMGFANAIVRTWLR